MNELAKKLLIKPGTAALVIQPPADYADQLQPLPGDAVLIFHPEEGKKYEVVQLFVRDRSDLAAHLPLAIPYLDDQTIFWISYPKKGSGIPTDLEMMRSWDELKAINYESVAAASVNDVWTALRWRPATQIKRSEACNTEIANNDLGRYIDVAARTILLPPDLKTLLETNSSALSFFQSLSFTNRKEYVVWILSAKQEKTRTERVTKTLEKLGAGKKNPSEK